MKSTGECLGIANTFNEALYKAFEGAGLKLPKHKNMIITVRDSEKENVVPIARRFQNVGYKIFATRGTAKVLNENGVKAFTVRKLEQESPNIMDLILGHEVDLVIDIPQQGAERSHDGFVIRRNAIETGVHVLTSLDTAGALATSLENRAKELTLIDIAKIKPVTYNAIERVEKFLKDAGTYYLATTEGDQPRVRPFGTAHIFEDKLYIQTGKVKDVSKQLHANPKAEITAFKDGEWIRVTGELVEDDRRDARESMLNAYPSLRSMYSEDDGNTEVFYFKNAAATISAFTHAPEVLKF